MSLKLGLRNKIRRSRAGGFTPLLDQSFATGATAAYSLRKLKSSANKAVRVREDSGNTETDIGFSNGTLDETALLNHVGSNNGFVTKWYDQSGNGNDASNSTASEQPQIVNSGSVIKENGKPAITLTESTFLLVPSVNMTSQSENWTFKVLKKLSSDIESNEISDNNQKSNSFVLVSKDGETNETTLANSATLNHFYINGSKSSASNRDAVHSAVHTDKQILETIDFTTDSNWTGNLGINAYPASKFRSKGTLQEYIFWQIDKSSERNKIETDINNFYSIF